MAHRLNDPVETIAFEQINSGWAHPNSISVSDPPPLLGLSRSVTAQTCLGPPILPSALSPENPSRSVLSKGGRMEGKCSGMESDQSKTPSMSGFFLRSLGVTDEQILVLANPLWLKLRIFRE